eukprot:12769-Heterococcus_DN1.PRE.5
MSITYLHEQSRHQHVLALPQLRLLCAMLYSLLARALRVRLLHVRGTRTRSVLSVVSVVVIYTAIAAAQTECAQPVALPALAVHTIVAATLALAQHTLVNSADTQAHERYLSSRPAAQAVADTSSKRLLLNGWAVCTGTVQLAHTVRSNAGVHYCCWREYYGCICWLRLCVRRLHSRPMSDTSHSSNISLLL